MYAPSGRSILSWTTPILTTSVDARIVDAAGEEAPEVAVQCAAQLIDRALGVDDRPQLRPGETWA